MRNDQAQHPRLGQTKLTKTGAKNIKIKTATMVKATTRATTGMEVIRERLHRSTHLV